MFSSHQQIRIHLENKEKNNSRDTRPKIPLKKGITAGIEKSLTNRNIDSGKKACPEKMRIWHLIVFLVTYIGLSVNIYIYF